MNALFYDEEYVISLFNKTLEDSSFSIFSALKQYEAAAPSKREVKNILVCTDHTNWLTGHFTAVVSLAKQLKDLGYNAILCLAKKPPAQAIPKNIPFEVNAVTRGVPNSLRKRLTRYKEICAKYEIDTAILNSWLGTNKYWDLLILQNLITEDPQERIRVLLHFHSSFAKPQFKLRSNWLRDTTSVIKAFDSLIAIGEVDAAFWSIYHPRVFYRPLPVEYTVSKTVPTRQPEDNTIIYIARYSDTKNQLASIEAFKLVAQQIPTAKLILAGNDHDNYRQKCRELINELGLQDNVQLLDFVSGPEKEALFNKAAIALNTSFFEGFPQYICEAKALGVPVVAYDLPNTSILAGDKSNGAIIVPQYEPELPAAEIVRVLKDANLQNQLSTAGWKHACELASFNYQAFWINVFESVRHPIPEMEERTTPYLINATLFDALYRASGANQPKNNTFLHKIYRKSPNVVKNAFRSLRSTIQGSGKNTGL